MVLDRDMLQECLAEKISHAYICKSTSLGLIIELLSVDRENKSKKYFYQLNVK